MLPGEHECQVALGLRLLFSSQAARFRGFSVSWPGVVVWEGSVPQRELVLLEGPAVAALPGWALFDPPSFFRANRKRTMWWRS